MFCFILENPMSLPLLSHSLIVFLSTLFVLEVYPLQKSSYLSERKELNLRKRAFVTFFVTHPRTTSYAKFISSLTQCSNKKGRRCLFCNLAPEPDLQGRPYLLVFVRNFLAGNGSGNKRTPEKGRKEIQEISFLIMLCLKL